MNYGMYLSASALQIGQIRMDVLANNMANVGTTSFKRDLAVIASRRPAPQEAGLPPHLTIPVLDDITGGLTGGGMYTDFTQGNLIKTDSDYDAAIQGDGFFSVMIDDEVRYTRDGRFDRSPDGYLVTATNGYRVLDDRGAPITLPQGQPSIDSEGTISVGSWKATLGLTDFANRHQLRKAGENAYAAPEGAEMTASTATIRHKHLEGSGVDPTRALVDMIVAQRTFEASAKMIQYTDSMLGKAVNDIARLA